MEAPSRFRQLRCTRDLCFLATALMPCLWNPLSISGQSSTPAQPYTFHVYEDLVQMPTLVMNSLHGSYPGLTAGQFTLSLDSGPPFHPRHVRLEAEDPITLALVLDTSSKAADKLAEKLNDTLAQLPANWLNARDHISVYAVNCALVRSVNDRAFTPAVLQDGVQAALASPAIHGQGATAARCGSSRKLWDTLATIVGVLGQTPGRHVVLVLTDGQDHRSRLSWRDLQLYASRFSVTLIGLRPASDATPRPSLNPSGWTDPQGTDANGTSVQKTPEEIFGMLCGGTGGLVLPIQRASLILELQRIVDLLRKRYILEFARPANGSTGLFELQVTVPERGAIVRTNGISFPVQDKALLSQPNVVPSDPSRRPQLGDRRVLTQPH